MQCPPSSSAFVSGGTSSRPSSARSGYKPTWYAAVAVDVTRSTAVLAQRVAANHAEQRAAYLSTQPAQPFVPGMGNVARLGYICLFCHHRRRRRWRAKPGTVIATCGMSACTSDSQGLQNSAGEQRKGVCCVRVLCWVGTAFSTTYTCCCAVQNSRGWRCAMKRLGTRGKCGTRSQPSACPLSRWCGSSGYGERQRGGCRCICFCTTNDCVHQVYQCTWGCWCNKRCLVCIRADKLLQMIAHVGRQLLPLMKHAHILLRFIHREAVNPGLLTSCHPCTPPQIPPYKTWGYLLNNEKAIATGYPMYEQLVFLQYACCYKNNNTLAVTSSSHHTDLWVATNVVDVATLCDKHMFLPGFTRTSLGRP